MLRVEQNYSSLPEHLNQKISFSTSLFRPNKVKEVSDTSIVFGPEEDTTAKVIALKAPVIKIESLISASNKLVIDTDLLIINGGYITEPKNWDIKAKQVRLQNVNEKSLWISNLIQTQNGVKSIEDANFNSKADPDCNFDIPAPKPAIDRIKEIGTEIKGFRDKWLKWK